MNTVTQHRVAAGVQEGGQFLPTRRAESDVRLDSALPTVPELTDTQRQAVEHLARYRHSWPVMRGHYEDAARFSEPVLRKLADLGLARYVERPLTTMPIVLPHYEGTFDTPQPAGAGDWTVHLPAGAASNQIAAAVVRGHLHRARGQSFYEPPRLRVVGAEPTDDGGTRFTVRMGPGERWTRAGLEPWKPKARE